MAVCAFEVSAASVRRTACLAAVSIAVPNAWPVLELLSLLALLPAELPWVGSAASMPTCFHPFMHCPHSALHSLAGSNGRASPNPRSVLLASAAEIQGSSASCEFMLHIGFVAMRQKVPHTAQIFLSIGAEQ